MHKSTTCVPHCLAVFLLLFTHSGCPKTASQKIDSLTDAPSTRLRIVQSFPHDALAYTQGLHFLDGKLYESTGLLGRSTLRQVDLKSGVVEKRVSLPATLFGEGLAQVGNRLFQLTWQNRKALVWDLATFEKIGEFAYEGEGWGICYNGKHLVMSDGTPKLRFRNPNTFAIEGEIQVRKNGKPLSYLNELECVQGKVLANVWQDSHIAVIHAGNGEVIQWIDATPLLQTLAQMAPEEANVADVLNGIAYMPQSGHFLLTGKLWPRIFEVALDDGP